MVIYRDHCEFKIKLFAAPMGKIAGKIFFLHLKHTIPINPPAAPSRCLQGTPDATFTRKRWGLAAHLPFIATHFRNRVEILSALSEALMIQTAWPERVTIATESDSEIWRDSILHS